MKSRHLLPLLSAALAACNLPTTTTPQPVEPTPAEQASTAAAQEQAEPTPSAVALALEVAVDKDKYECVDDAEPRFARLMHDPQWMPWPSRIADPDWPRGFSSDRYPETVPLWRRPRSGDGQWNYTRAWLEYLYELQVSDEGAVWLTLPGAGLFDRDNEPIPILELDKLSNQPHAEGISAGGNVVLVLETRSGSARIQTMYDDDGPPDPAEVNYQDTPWLVTKFTSVSIDGELGNAGGYDVYFPNVGNHYCGLWVDLQRVEMFPRLPFDAVTKSSLSLHESPSDAAANVGSVGGGQTIQILEYYPRGSNVWGRTANGWLILERLRNGLPVYTTSWSMETRPPILFP